MAARFLEANTCEDRCGIVKTGEKHEGAPIYRCPGCDSRWWETSDLPGEKQTLASLRKRFLRR